MAEILGCGHNCGGVCGKCLKKGENVVVLFEHPRCTKKCDRPHGVCNHRCLKVWHNGESCGNCEAKCELRLDFFICLVYFYRLCIHLRRCLKSCLKRLWERLRKDCVYQKGSMLTLGLCLPLRKGMCTMYRKMHLGLPSSRLLHNALRSTMWSISVPCDQLPCDERCTKILDCGHQCPSLCGETVQVVYVKNAVTSQMLVSISLNGNLILKSTSIKVSLLCSGAAIFLPVSRSMV